MTCKKKRYTLGGLISTFLLISTLSQFVKPNASANTIYIPSPIDDKVSSDIKKESLTLTPKKEISIIEEVSVSKEDEQDVNKEDELKLSNLESVKVIATGYTAGPESTGKRPGDEYYGITSTGVEVRRDQYSTIAADPSIFPYGTILYIPGYGLGVVSDCGGAIKGNKLDLFFHTIEDVYEQWGKKEVNVYIVERGEGYLDENTMDVLNNKDTPKIIY